MSDLVVDSSVVAKWILPEADSAKAQELIDRSASGEGRLMVLDLAFPEVGKAIWKQCRSKKISAAPATRLFEKLAKLQVHLERAIGHLTKALAIAIRYDRAVYDALFVALARAKGVQGVTADEPLFNATHRDFPEIVLLRNL